MERHSGAITDADQFVIADNTAAMFDQVGHSERFALIAFTYEEARPEPDTAPFLNIDAAISPKCSSNCLDKTVTGRANRNVRGSAELYAVTMLNHAVVAQHVDQRLILVRGLLR
jgi:hypothetical protein